MPRGIALRVEMDRTRVLSDQIRHRAWQVIRKAAFDIEAHAKASMSGPKSGVVYGNHQASAPGEAPAIDTGNLINSLQIEETGDLEMTVSVNAEYAEALEFGTSKMAPRPFMEPATEAVREGFVRAMTTVAKG